jgi:protein SCO1
MRRREFLVSLLGGLAGWPLAAWPSAAQAQLAFPPVGSAPTFTLTAMDGTAVTEQTYRGKWLVVYFGYTFCPDICPTTMLEIAAALQALGPRADAVLGLFITVDPQRDTPAVLTEYLQSFDPRLVGLAGTRAQIAAAATAFHVIYERNDADDGTYSYDHSSFVYLLDRDGKFAKAIPSDAGSKLLMDAFSALIAAGQ